MKIYGRIDNFRLLKVKVILDDKETIFEGMVEDAPKNIKEMKYSKVDMGIDTTIYVYSENQV